MNKHLKYLSYVIRHKWFVFYAGIKFAYYPLALMDVRLFWNLIIHDWSKFLPSEWFPYVNTFYGNGADENAFNTAWLKHQHRNPHHWQHWLLAEDNPAKRLKAVGGSDTPRAIPLEMPEHYTLEMVADWMGAGRAISGKWEVWEWYEKNRENIVIHENTKSTVDWYMMLVKYKLMRGNNG